MAVFTPLAHDDARAIAARLGLGELRGVQPVAAGSVNSNFVLDTGGAGRVFVRLYEEQGDDGVAFEWSVLEELARAGVAVVPPLRGAPAVAPGELRAGGRPVAAFRLVDGTQACQRGVNERRAAGVGAVLARCHRVALAWGVSRRGRFGVAETRARIARGLACGRPPIVAAAERLTHTLAELEAAPCTDLPVAVVHGDLFRDNILWEGDELVAALDWESAADETLVYDLSVTLLAWCFSDRLEPSLARALVGAYHAVRPLSPAEMRALRAESRRACVRFAASRITDFALRDGIGERVVKDYRRFLARLDAVEALDARAYAETLLGAAAGEAG